MVLEAVEFSRDVPGGLLEVLHLSGWVLVSGAGKVFDGIPPAEVEMLGKRNHLDRIAGVVGRMVDRITHGFCWLGY